MIFPPWQFIRSPTVSNHSPPLMRGVGCVSNAALAYTGDNPAAKERHSDIRAFFVFINQDSKKPFYISVVYDAKLVEIIRW